MDNQPSPTTEPRAASPPSEDIKAAPKRWLIFVCLFAAVIHGMVCFTGGEGPRSPDEQEYLSLAVGLVEDGRLCLSGGEFAKRMPLYPALLALLYKTQVSEYWQSAALLMQGIVAWCGTIMIAVIAYRLADGRAGWIAGVTASVYAPILYLQTHFLTESLSIFLLLAAVLVYITLCLRPRSWVRHMLSLAGVSILLGFGILTRANAALFLLPFIGDTLLRAGTKRQRAVRLVVLVAPAMCLAAGWAARNHREIGSFRLSTIGGLNFYLGHNPTYTENPGLDRADYAMFDRVRAEEGLDEVEADRRLYDLGLDYIRGHPGRVAINSLRKIGVWFKPTSRSFGPVLPLLLLVVLVQCAWKGRCNSPRGHRAHLALPIAVVLVASLLTYYAVVLVSDPTVRVPFTSSLHVLSLGVPALLLFRPKPAVKWLFIGLVSSQLLVAIVFIPLSRLRWAVDPVFIIAIAVGASNLGGWLLQSAQIERR